MQCSVLIVTHRVVVDHRVSGDVGVGVGFSDLVGGLADDNGQFSITPTRGGLLYLFVTLHKRVQPDRWESHNAALTLEAALQP